MGQIESEIIAKMREKQNRLEPWDTGRLRKVLYREASGQQTLIRQTSRAVMKASVIPKALTIECVVRKIRDHQREEKITEFVQLAKQRRMRISIVQMKEVRLGIWALLWNNLRQARRWLWLHGDPNEHQASIWLMENLLKDHESECCLVFDESAKVVKARLVDYKSSRIASLGNDYIVLRDSTETTFK